MRSSQKTREERVRARAHEIWEQAGRPHGHELAHWRQAEAEIAGSEAPKTRRTAPKAAKDSKPAAKPRAAAGKATKERAAAKPRAAASRGRRKDAAE